MGGSVGQHVRANLLGKLGQGLLAEDAAGETHDAALDISSFDQPANRGERSSAEAQHVERHERVAQQRPEELRRGGRRAEDERHDRWFLEHQAADGARFLHRGSEGDQRAPRVAHQMRREDVDRAQEGEKVVDVRLHRVLRSGREVLVGPGVAAAVCNGLVALSDRGELRTPDRQVADAAVHEHDGFS